MALELINIDPRELLTLLKSEYYSQTGETLQIGSNEFAVASTQSYVWSILLNNINNHTLNRFIDYATGEYLDAIAANYGINERPSGYHATAEFEIEALVQTTVPKGSIIVEDDAGNQFTNPYDTYIHAVEPTERIILQSVESGERFNGIPEGEIHIITSGSAYISSAFSTTMTSGGTDGFEDDDVYREWLKTEIQSFAGAGTYQAYEARAKNADSRIIDSYVLRQSDEGYEKGKVKIYILTDRVTDTTSECLYIVKESCSDDAFRPIGDFVEVRYSPETVVNPVTRIQVTYPQQFSAIADQRNARIIGEYRDYLKNKINRPFVFDEICSLFTKKDADGVYALDAKPIGVSTYQYPTPIYPVKGGRINFITIPTINVFA